MVSQAKGGCSECGSKFHTAMYHKPKKPLKRTPIKRKMVLAPVVNFKEKITQAELRKRLTKMSKKPTESRSTRPETRSKLVKKLDAVFSQYVRISASQDGNTTCVTCYAVKPWKEMQAGHYESRGHYPTRWREDNVHPQCYACNVLRKGNYTMYALYMIREYGEARLQELHVAARSGEKITTPQLREMIQEYTNKVKGMI